MSAIFISYNRHDAAVAQEILDWLGQLKHRSVFLDFDPALGVPAGRDWEQELYQQMRACRAVVVILTEHWTESKWCFAELALARALGKALLPIAVDSGVVVNSLVADYQVTVLSEGKSLARQRIERGLRRAGLDPTDNFDWDGTRPPFPGLMAFQEADAAIFFGRDDELHAAIDLLNRIRRFSTAGFLIVVGSSGSGKSSLVRAGLLPRLRRDPERWIVVGAFRPGDAPLTELARAFSTAFEQVARPVPPAVIASRIRGASERAGVGLSNPLLALAQELRQHAGRDDAHVLLVVDQFEQLLGRPEDEDSTLLLTLLREAADCSPSVFTTLATMRSDFVGQLQNSRALLDVRFETISVGPMSSADLQQTIEEPAEVAGAQLEPGLVQQLISDASGSDTLPLLAFTLRELFEYDPQHRWLTLTAYRDRLGGLQGAIARVADDLVRSARLTPELEVDLRIAFLRMVRLTDDDRWVRRVVRWEDLPASVRPLLERFVAARLLVVGDSKGTRVVEVAHESLMRSWGQLATWLDQSTDVLRLRRDLHLSALNWAASDRHATDLWRGARLDRALELLATDELHLEEPDADFLDASRDAEVTERRSAARRRRRRRQSWVAVLVLALTAAALFVRSRVESDLAALRRAQQIIALDLVRTADQLVDENPALALAVAAEADSIATGPVAARDVLARASSSFAARSGQQIGPPLTGHTDTVTDVQFSADMRELLSVGIDGTLRTWDATTGDPRGPAIAFHDGAVERAVLSPTGRSVVYEDENSMFRLWSLDSGTIGGEPLDVSNTDTSWAGFSPDGAILAIGLFGEPVHRWRTETGSPLPPLVPPDLHFPRGFSPDGLLVTDSIDEVIVWNPTTGARVLTTELPAGEWLGFGPTGHHLAIQSPDRGGVTLWDPHTQTFVGEPIIRDETSDRITYSEDGKLVASVNVEERAVKVWDPRSGEQIGAPIVSPAFSGPMALSADGTRMATVNSDGTVRLWALGAGTPLDVELVGTPDSPGVTFSPDGAVVVAAGSARPEPGEPVQGHIQLWSTAAGRPIGPDMEEAGGNLRGVAIDRTGKWIAAGDSDGQVIVWDADAGHVIDRPPAGSSRVSSLAFSPDGTVLAAVSGDGILRMWATETWSEIRQIANRQRESSISRSLAFSPDGQVVASIADDNAIQLRDVDSGDLVAPPFQGRNGMITALAFSPDGERLAANEGERIVVWDTATGDRIGAPRLTTSPITEIVFSPDGAVLAAAERDRVTMWDSGVALRLGDPIMTGTPTYGVAISPDGRYLAYTDGDVWIRPAVWDVERACALAVPYVTREQVEAYLPSGQSPSACELT